MSLGIVYLILIILFTYVLPAVAVVVIILLCGKLVTRSDRVSALEKRIERLERQIDNQYEAISQKIK
jgi:Flp pilus assembly protein TadB